MRPTDYLRVVFRNIRRKTTRSVLTIMALSISSSVLFIMVTLSISGQSLLREQFGTNDTLARITVTNSQSAAPLGAFGSIQRIQSPDTPTPLDDAAVARLAALPHVIAAEPRATVWELAAFSVDGTDTQFVAQTIGTPGLDVKTLQAGQTFTTDTDHQVVLGYAYTRALGFDKQPDQLLGKQIIFTTQKSYRGGGATILPDQSTALQATIVGITRPGPDQNQVFIPMGWARDIRTFHAADHTTDQLAKDGYSAIQVQTASLDTVASTAEAIEQLGYGSTALLDTVNRLNQLAKTVGLILGAVSVTAVLAATLGVVNTMITAVSERRYEVGVWRACGARRRTIASLFLFEAMILGICGGTTGVVIGLVVNNYIAAKGEAMLQAQGFQAVTLLPISVTLAVATIVATTILSVIAGWYPARRAAQLDPSRILNSN